MTLQATALTTKQASILKARLATNIEGGSSTTDSNSTDTGTLNYLIGQGTIHVITPCARKASKLQPRSPLLQLPRELRNLIYQFAYSRTTHT